MRIALVLLVACRSTPAPDPIAGRADTPPERVSDSTLVLVEPDGGDCVLRRRDPVAKIANELARLPGDCLGARVAWRTKLDRAVVWFQPGNVHSGGYAAQGAPQPGHPDEEREIKERAYEVELAGGKVLPLTLPNDRAQELAYGADGALYAFAEQDLPKATGKVTVRGHELDFSDHGDGIPAAALALRRTAAGWQLASVTKTSTGWDYAAGWSAAPEATGLGPRSTIELAAHAETAEITDTATRAALARIAKPDPKDDGDGWTQIATPHGPIHVWQVTGEFSYTTGRIAWGQKDATRLLPELGFTAGEMVALIVRGKYLLVAGANAGAYPRLYDLATKQRVFASETARAAMFWPTASSSASGAGR